MDDIDNLVDNSVLVLNPDQRDTDRDGWGNACDADLNNDGVVPIPHGARRHHGTAWKLSTPGDMPGYAAYLRRVALPLQRKSTSLRQEESS